MALLLTGNSKLTVFLLLITLVSSSYWPVAESGLLSGIVKGIVKNGGKKVLPKASVKGVQQAIVEHIAKTTSKKLAAKYFGPAGGKGFRWGWKGTKYYLKVEDSCNRYEAELNLNYCTPSSNYTRFRPDCLVNCIVETFNVTLFGVERPTCYYGCTDPTVPMPCNETFIDDAICGTIN